MTISLEQIQDEWRKDAKIDRTELSNESLKVSQLHEKYLRFLNASKKEYRMMKKGFSILKKNLNLYYRGNLDQESLDSIGRKQWKLAYKTNAELTSWIEEDEDYVDAMLELSEMEDAIESCENILKSIHNRGFQIKNVIENEKFLAGR